MEDESSFQSLYVQQHTAPPEPIGTRSRSGSSSSSRSSSKAGSWKGSPTNSDEHLYKTELCRSWEATQACQYGNKCRFAHGPQELRPVSRHPKYKTQPCKTFREFGHCPYGPRCRFIHDELDAMVCVSAPGALEMHVSPRPSGSSGGSSLQSSPRKQLSSSLISPPPSHTLLGRLHGLQQQGSSEAILMQHSSSQSSSSSSAAMSPTAPPFQPTSSAPLTFSSGGSLPSLSSIVAQQPLPAAVSPSLSSPRSPFSPLDGMSPFQMSPRSPELDLTRPLAPSAVTRGHASMSFSGEDGLAADDSLSNIRVVLVPGSTRNTSGGQVAAQQKNKGPVKNSRLPFFQDMSSQDLRPL